jgi:hypothetical protein
MNSISEHKENPIKEALYSAERKSSPPSSFTTLFAI